MDDTTLKQSNDGSFAAQAALGATADGRLSKRIDFQARPLVSPTSPASSPQSPRRRVSSLISKFAPGVKGLMVARRSVTRRFNQAASIDIDEHVNQHVRQPHADESHEQTVSLGV